MQSHFGHSSNIAEERWKCHANISSRTKPMGIRYHCSSMLAKYSLDSIRESSSAESVTLMRAIQPSCSGLSLIVFGLSSRTEFPSITLPATGESTSEADLTDSTAPTGSPAPTSVSTAGSSTKTTSPRDLAAYSVIPILAGEWNKSQISHPQKSEHLVSYL
jgi:hypothetical protein